MRRFHAVIELDGPDMLKSRRMDAHVTSWTLRGARRKAIKLAQAYAQQYREHGQELSQYQLIHFEEMKGSRLRPLLLLLLAILAAAYLGLGL